LCLAHPNAPCAFRRSPDFDNSHSAQARICVLEEYILFHEHHIAMLELFLNSQIPRQEQTSEAVNAAFARLSQVELIVDSLAREQILRETCKRSDMTSEAVNAALHL
jgi:hypothetical protein